MVTTLIITRAIHIGASILIAGIFTFDLVTLGLAGPVKSDLHEIDRRLFSLALWSLLVSLVSAVLWFWLEVANMNGLSFVDAFSARAWQKVLFETVFGHLWLLRLGITAVALVLAVSQLAGNDVPRRPAILALFLRHPHCLRCAQPILRKSNAAQGSSRPKRAGSAPPQCDFRGVPRCCSRRDRRVFRRDTPCTASMMLRPNERPKPNE